MEIMLPTIIMTPTSVPCVTVHANALHLWPHVGTPSRHACGQHRPAHAHRSMLCYFQTCYNTKQARTRIASDVSKNAQRPRHTILGNTYQQPMQLTFANTFPHTNASMCRCLACCQRPFGCTSLLGGCWRLFLWLEGENAQKCRGDAGSPASLGCHVAVHGWATSKEKEIYYNLTCAMMPRNFIRYGNRGCL